MSEKKMKRSARKKMKRAYNDRRYLTNIIPTTTKKEA
jgi:hypothetical protein